MYMVTYRYVQFIETCLLLLSLIFNFSNSEILFNKLTYILRVFLYIFVDIPFEINNVNKICNVFNLVLTYLKWKKNICIFYILKLRLIFLDIKCIWFLWKKWFIYKFVIYEACLLHTHNNIMYLLFFLWNCETKYVIKGLWSSISRNEIQ